MGNKKTIDNRKKQKTYTKRTIAFRWPHGARMPLRKWLVIVVGIVLALILLAYIAFHISPRPGSLIIRAVFDHGANETLKAMEAKLPNYPVTVLANQQYRKNDKDAVLDVYIPNSAIAGHGVLPAVIWTHGGGWLSGDKTDDAPYFKRLADQGFVVIAPNYSLAPGKTYPTPIHQLNDGYAYIQHNAARYHLDPNNIVLAGDSAGAQLSSQMAALITNPAYAREVGIKPALQPSHLTGVVLFCGIYKMEKLAEPSPSLPKVIDWGDNTTVWAYAGTRDESNPRIRQMSAYYHITGDFPRTFISGGNGDPLTNSQSVLLAKKLDLLGVNVTSLFYSPDHSPKLPHEYQFTFNDDGEKAFGQMTQFLNTNNTSGQQ